MAMKLILSWIFFRKFRKIINDIFYEQVRQHIEDISDYELYVMQRTSLLMLSLISKRNSRGINPGIFFYTLFTYLE